MQAQRIWRMNERKLVQSVIHRIIQGLSTAGHQHGRVNRSDGPQYLGAEDHSSGHWSFGLRVVQIALRHTWKNEVKKLLLNFPLKSELDVKKWNTRVKKITLTFFQTLVLTNTSKTKSLPHFCSLSHSSASEAVLAKRLFITKDSSARKEQISKPRTYCTATL